MVTVNAATATSFRSVQPFCFVAVRFELLRKCWLLPLLQNECWIREENTKRNYQYRAGLECIQHTHTPHAPSNRSVLIDQTLKMDSIENWLIKVSWVGSGFFRGQGKKNNKTALKSTASNCIYHLMIINGQYCWTKQSLGEIKCKWWENISFWNYEQTKNSSSRIPCSIWSI